MAHFPNKRSEMISSEQESFTPPGSPSGDGNEQESFTPPGSPSGDGTEQESFTPPGSPSGDGAEQESFTPAGSPSGNDAGKTGITAAISHTVIIAKLIYHSRQLCSRLWPRRQHFHLPPHRRRDQLPLITAARCRREPPVLNRLSVSTRPRKL